MGITQRIALLSWSVTIFTVLIFVVVIIPEQKRIFIRNLESKAHGIAVSLQDVAAGAVVNEDYSSVVDHCVQLLKGDPAIAHLVMTRADGFSIVNERSKWRIDTLDGSWHPVVRKPSSAIEVSPLFNRRAFQYSKPFDYSGIEWGWIHVGLSLDDYDRSVSRVYQRTGMLAALCIVLSFIASTAYARRLVRPIQSLETTVGQIARGDLSARAAIQSGDEIEGLANAFNSMTDALRRRDRILEGVRFAAQELLSTEDWKQAIHGVLAKLGQAAEASRAYIFENHNRSDGTLVCSHRYEWVVPGILPQIDDPEMQSVPWLGSGLDAWMQTLVHRKIVTAHVRELGPELQTLLGPTIRSLILIPIIVRGAWWGFVGFDQCDREREWSDAERDSFRAAAEMLGAAIERKQTQDALLEAKATLEQRVEERTRELRGEVAAKERARTKLAEAQQLLIDVSRKSGMAEIATGVLHNVGNVLNSVNVSANLLVETIRKSRVSRLNQLAALVREHEHDLPEFFRNDARAKHVPTYLNSLAEHLEQEHAELRNELTQLASNVDHIKQIVSMQQNYASVAGVIENLEVANVVEDALRLTEAGLTRDGITLVRRFDPVPSIASDRHKIIQILINLLRNARQAVEAGHGQNKSVVLSIHPAPSGSVRVQVCDNGVGIASENLTRVFSHGFTTKRDGHGFGLHMSALAAKEIGGSLSVESGGLGQGATFTLELPLERAVDSPAQCLESAA